MSNHKYYYDDYYDDVSAIVDRYKIVPNLHIVGLYSDGLPAAIHLSSALDCPMSIIRVVDDEAVWLLNLTEDKSLRGPSTPLFPRVVVVDAVYDSGDKFRAVKQLPEFINNPDYTFFTFFGCKNDMNVSYIYEQVYRNILFPWHGIKEESEQRMSL